MGEDEKPEDTELENPGEEQREDEATLIEPMQPGNSTGGHGPFTHMVIRFWWIGVIIVALIVALIVYLTYENHQKTEYNLYMTGAATAMSNGNYSLAVTDYKKAQSYKNLPDVQSQLQQAQHLETEHKTYVKGEQAFNAGNYQAAIVEFNQVNSDDKTDYALAQKGIQRANAAIAAKKDQHIMNTIYNNALAAYSDVGALSNDINGILTDENNIVADSLGTAKFNTDMSTMHGGINTSNTDIKTLAADAGSFNADAQGLQSKKANVIVNKVENAMSQLENGFSDLSSIANTNYAEFQRQDNYYSIGSSYVSQSSVNQWNTDITSIDDGTNTFSNLISQLKTYVNKAATSTGGNL